MDNSVVMGGVREMVEMEEGIERINSNGKKLKYFLKLAFTSHTAPVKTAFLCHCNISHKWAWLCFNKTLFTKLDSWSDLSNRS